MSRATYSILHVKKRSKEYFMVKKENNLVAKKPNKIIGARQGLSVLQHRIIFGVLAQLKTKIATTKIETVKDYNDFIKATYEIKIADIVPDIKKQRVTENCELFNYIEKESEKIQNQRHVVKNDDGWESYTLIDYVKFYRKELRLEVRIAVSILPVLHQWFIDGFTKIPMREIIPLRSKYSIRIFEKLLRVVNITDIKKNGYTVSYEELRKQLGITKGQYKKFSDFKRDVLDQAYKEINEKTFMRFSFNLEREKYKVKNICFYDITHEVKENLPQQIEMFDFEQIEIDREKHLKENAINNLEEIVKIDKIRNLDDDKEKAKKIKELQARDKVIEEERERKKFEAEMKKELSEELKSREEERVNQFFTTEQLEKLEKYLDGIWSAKEIKAKFDFDYIEFYYKKAVEINSTGEIKSFANLLHNLIVSDKLNYAEIKAKEEDVKAKQAAQRKAEFERRKEEQKQEQIKKEKEAADIKRRIILFNSLDDNQREKYLNEFYATNHFYKDVIDKDGISDFTKISIGQLLEK
jgi:plasmid replication initiation protein